MFMGMALKYVCGAFLPVLFSVAGIYIFFRSRRGELKPYGVFIIESVLLQIPLIGMLAARLRTGEITLPFCRLP